jgi:DNA-binding transcriptional regulator PaaX
MNVLKMLEKEEKKMADRLEGLRAAISALNGAGKVRGRRSGRKRGWHMSEAAKLRISRAQKARWRAKQAKA